MCDQLAASWLPAYGHGIVSAPAIDGLARDGVVFDSAYCPFPLCAPSRAALLAGRHASGIGVYDNAAELPASVPTLVHRLRAAGYDTCLSGKMHFVGPDQLHGFERRLTTDVYPADLDWTPDWRVPAGERMPWYHSMESVLEPGVCAAAMQTDYDDEVAHRAVRKLRDLARDRTRPFFLCVSFTNPHDPWELPPQYWDRYDADAIDMPAVGAIPLAEADPHSARLRAMSGIDGAQLSGEQIRRARHGYYAAISYADERIGEVLAALDATGLRDDTIVVFTSDHGEMLGERGLWYKMAFFEQSVRVPLIVSAPRRFPTGRVSVPVSGLDLLPTLLELCGLPPADGVDGRSLAPALSGGSLPPADVFVEYLAEGVSAPAVMVRRGRWKYVWSGSDPELLFDMEADPRELSDVAADHPSLCAVLRAEVERRWDMPALTETILRSQAERRVVVAGLNAGRRAASWSWVPEMDSALLSGSDDLYEVQRRARLDSPAR
jgi:choline-sulfatase